jgi:hypothetical protein
MIMGDGHKRLNLSLRYSWIFLDVLDFSLWIYQIHKWTFACLGWPGEEILRCQPSAGVAGVSSRASHISGPSPMHFARYWGCNWSFKHVQKKGWIQSVLYDQINVDICGWCSSWLNDTFGIGDIWSSYLIGDIWWSYLSMSFKEIPSGIFLTVRYWTWPLK